MIKLKQPDSILPTPRDSDFEETVVDHQYSTNQVELRHLVLNKGASKGICLTPSTVTDIIERERDELSNDINILMDSYIALIKLQPFMSKMHLENRYFSYVQKSIEMRYSSKVLNDLSEEIDDSKLLRQEVKADQKRDYYSKYAMEEGIKGIAYQNNLYKFYNSPVVFEQKYRQDSLISQWVPDSSSCDNSFKEAVFEETKDTEDSESIQTEPCHVIFMVHGYRGKISDMSNLRNMILKKYPKSRIYV